MTQPDESRKPHTYLLRDEGQPTKSFIIKKNKHPAPSFIPEVKGPEDLHILLNHVSAMEKYNPVLVPAHRWLRLIGSRQFQGFTPENIALHEFVKNHSFLFYEPPELFRYALPTDLVTYALKGNVSETKQFNKALESRNEARALELIPPFFKPFLEREMGSLYKSKKLPVPAHRSNEKPRVDDGWLDERVLDGYRVHVANIVAEALRIPNATIIPTVPPLLKSSDATILRRISSANKLSEIVCKSQMLSTLDGSVSKVDSYFHIYMDQAVIATGPGNGSDVALRILEDGLKVGDYSGVAITITGYEEIIRNSPERLRRFLTDTASIAEGHSLPLILPRSGWYGLWLTDLGVNAFGSLLNGNPRYIQGVGGLTKEKKFGATPIIDLAKELSHPDLTNYLNRNKQVPSVPGLPTRPSKEAMEDPIIFRITFSKPLRLIHCEEARRIRKGQVQGVRNPAKRYFERSDHPDLKGL